LFVIARNSSLSYRDRGANTREIGRNLGVRYVLEGSIRRSGERLRFTAQLVEAASGNHIWAEKYDRPVGDIFDLQDDLTRSITASTQTHIALEEGARAERTERPQLNVWLLIKRSWGRLHDLTPEGLAEARSFAERALELAPRSGLAHEVLSVVLIHQVFMRTAGDVRVTLGKARDAAMRAAELEGSSEYAFWALGMVQFTSGEPEQAILTLRQGLEINPNCAVLHATIGNYLALMGQADESIAATELAMRINPRDPSIFFRYQALADAYFVKRDFEKMVAWASKGVVVKPSYFGVHARAISGLGLLGRIAEAQTSIQQMSPKIFGLEFTASVLSGMRTAHFSAKASEKGDFLPIFSKVPR
jgi:tetratricopeptide (TPR) repeat protein